jgi:hypothetical protein
MRKWVYAKGKKKATESHRGKEDHRVSLGSPYSLWLSVAKNTFNS